jgi:hypothetical protein
MSKLDQRELAILKKIKLNRALFVCELSSNEFILCENKFRENRVQVREENVKREKIDCS